MSHFSTILSFIFVLIVLNSSQTTAQVYPVSDQENNGGWILNESISDEFNGTELDKTKWWILGENDDYRNKWKGRAPGQFVAHNVRVENGDLILSSKWEPEFVFANEKNNGVYYGGTETSADNSLPITQACVMSETFFRYGYMEIRCKAADAPVTSSFWTTGYHSEIDMTENYGKRPIANPNNKPLSLEKKYRTNMISWDPDKAPDHKNWKVEDVLDVRVASDYFVYGFEWDKDYIKTYFNGELIRYATREELEANDQWRHQYPQELWLDSEVFSWYGLPAQEDLATSAEYKIDYVRIWQKEINGPDFDALGFEGPFYYQGRSRPWWSSAASSWRIKDEKPASGDFSLRFQKSGSFSGTYSVSAPFGSSDLPKGNNSISFKIWIDPGTTVNKIDFVLNNPWIKITADLSDVEKGKWIELTESFSRDAASDLSLSSGDRMQINLNASDITGSEALLYIDDIVFENDNVTSIVEPKSTDISIYPNPANDILTINAKEEGRIRIFNCTGKLVKLVEKSSFSEQINISELKTGVYFVSVLSDNRNVTQKVLITH
nr:T9SS type A sorting domain-containing protein [uncultured Draconibacterium sp.]